MRLRRAQETRLFKMLRFELPPFQSGFFETIDTFVPGPSQASRRKTCTVDHFHQNCSQFYIQYSHYYKTVLYLFLRLFSLFSQRKIVSQLSQKDLLVRLLFKRVLYWRAFDNSKNTVC